MLHWYQKFKPGLWRALLDESPDRHLIERLLKSWCRVTTFKNGKVVDMKESTHNKSKQLDIVYLMEKYENTIEFALALLAGKAFVVKMWKEKGMMPNNIDVNTRDYSYQYRYPDYPVVPRPLLTTLWEKNIYEIVDVLMDMNPDTGVLFTDEPEAENPPKPLFLHAMSGLSRPTDERIIQRILRGSDLTARNQHGATILFEAIFSDQTDNMMKFLFSQGVNVATRARCGRTARDVSEHFRKKRYTDLIDHHVLQIVKDCDIERLENLILQSYDHILDLRDEHGNTTLQIARKKGSKQLIEVLQNTVATQEHCKKLFLATDKGNLSLVKKLLTKKYANALDKCGRSPLHHALLSKHGKIVRMLVEECPQMINKPDNTGRTPLHYARLFMDQDDTIDFLCKKGADSSIKDVRGWTPQDYSRENCGPHEFAIRQQEVEDFDLEIFLAQTNFPKSFLHAIRKGDMTTVQNFTSGLKRFNAASRFSSVLFECLDNGQYNIAEFLIKNGFSPDVWKQYEACDPDNPLCAMMECNHTVISFKQRAVDIKATSVVKLLDDIDSGKVKVPGTNNKIKPDISHFCNYGLV